MKFIKAVLMSIACISMVSGAYAADHGRSVDVRKFDVAGVKSGMDFDEARQAMAANFNVPIESIKIGTPLNDPIVPSPIPKLLYYQGDGVSLEVNFVSRAPYDKDRPLVVWNIKYSMQYTQQNAENMKKAALAKYGVQSSAKSPLRGLEWCKNPQKNKEISTLYGACGNQPRLNLLLTDLMLFDPTWADAANKFLNETKARKPSF